MSAMFGGSALATCGLDLLATAAQCATRALPRSLSNRIGLSTDALNALNRAQAAFDATVEKMRESAPWNSDWHSRNRRGVEVG